jgi:membrane associated rhomboid family serine protease
VEAFDMKLRYNSPVILSFSLISAAVLLISQLTGGAFIQNFFVLYPGFNFASPLSWFRLFSYVIGHANWNHLISNFSFILLIGPILEEKYGSGPILLMMLVTAVATAIVNNLFTRTGLYGASGIVFMLILLSSFTNIRSGELPLTFILIIILYLVREFVNALTPNTVSQLAHIAGGVIGGLFGFLFAGKEAPPKRLDAGTEGSGK